MYGIASFVLGGYLSYYKIDVFGAFRDKRYLLCPIVIMGLFGSFLLNIFKDTFSEPSGIFKLMMLPLFYLLYDWISFIMKTSFFHNYFMPASFTIYAVHIFFTSIFMHILGGFMPKIVGSMFIITIFTIIFSLLSSIILWRVANAIFPRGFRILDGRW
jgi:peptidoglycan/LPS O-acetylase OafA/YrhL